MKQRIQKEYQKQVILNEKAVQSSTLTNPKEKGRSMVEMLGVLAVIGVLSVGGIMGYKYGMMKYRVNETINELNIMANTYGVQMQQMTEEQTLPTEGELLSEENAVTRMGYGYEVLGFDNHFEIALFNVPNPECEQLQKTGWELPYEIKAETVTAESCGELVYYIDNGLTGTLTEYVDSDEEDDDETDKKCGLYGHWNGEKCICDEGYIGNKCQNCDMNAGYRMQDTTGRCYNTEDYNLCTREDFCNGHGYAAQAGPVCNCSSCDSGYYGVHCENKVDEGEKVCNGNGSWAEKWYNGSTYYFDGGGCMCKTGYYGRRCETTNPDEVCSGHGVIGQYAYGYCSCLDGWSGENCEIEQPTKECGILIENGSQYSGYPVYINDEVFCQCQTGYYGEKCEQKCTNSCTNGSPVYKDGKCQCVCTSNTSEKYYADTCVTCPSCKHGTFNSGTALYNVATQSCECECFSGYYGTNCENQCSSSATCNGHGYTRYNAETQSCECRSCYSGYYGKNCEFQHTCTSANTCNNNGTAYFDTETQSCACSCSSSYHGEHCEFAYRDTFCNSHGYPVFSGSEVIGCSCDNGYVGARCETTCTSACVNGVTDPYGDECSCICHAGYYGPDCSQQCNLTCQNGGVLYNIGSSCKCACKTGYYGENCQNKCTDEITCPTGKTAVYVNGICGCVLMD